MTTRVVNKRKRRLRLNLMALEVELLGKAKYDKNEETIE